MFNSNGIYKRKAYVKQLLCSVFFVMLLFFAVSAPAASTSMQLNRVIAVVNGELITMFDLQQHAMPEIIRSGFTGSDRQSVAERDRIFNQSLETMVLDILYKQEAERYKITADDGDVENELRRVMQSNNITDPAEFERQIATQGMTMEELRKRLRDNLVRQRLLGAMVMRKADVTPEEVQAYYNAHVTEYSTPDSVEFSVIALGPGRDVEAVREEITSGRSTFAEAAKKYSDWPTAAIGGSMGNLPWSDLNPAWVEAMQGLEAGQTSAPVVSGDITVLLHVDALNPGNSQDFETVAAQIEDRLREDKLRDRLDEYSNQLKSKAVVEIKI